jgi:DNA-binding IclR family transcriptional regulator
MAGGSTRWQGRSVVSKLTSLLDAFSVERPELSLGEITRITGLPSSTAYRMVCDLVAWGGLERASSGAGYRVGVRLWELGALAPRPADLREVALPFMQDLYEVTRENVHLAVLEGHEALYVETISGPHALRVRSRRAGRLPLHATGVGKVLLAHAPEQVVRDVVAAGLPRYTPHTVVDPDRLHRVLADVRRNGIAYAREEMSPGSLSVAAPVTDADGEVTAALAVVLRSGRRDLGRLGVAVRTAAVSTSRSLRRQAWPASPSLRAGTTV